MLLTHAISLLALATPPTLKPEITGASLFKNAFALVNREVAIPSAGEYVIDDIPQAALGTFWVVTSGDLSLDWLRNTTANKDLNNPARSFDEILALNIGKTITFEEPQFNGTRTITGKLISVSGNMVVLESDGKYLVFNHSFSKAYLPTGSKLEGSTIETRVLKLKARGKGTLRMVTLESGLYWTPAYLVELGDKGELKLTAKSTITNELGSIHARTMRLVTGFPNMEFLNQMEPLSYFVSRVTSGYLKDAQSVGQPYGNFNGAAGGGGFGGAARETPYFANQAAASRPAMDAFTNAAISGGSAEDLFLYDLPGADSEKGDRSYNVLFEDKHTYKDLYTLNLPLSEDANAYNNQPRQAPLPEVWHTLVFDNKTAHPLTTGSAMVMQKGNVLAQCQLNYTSAGAECQLKLAKALDVQPELEETEVSRNRLTKNINYRVVDEVNLQGQIRVQNRKSETVHLVITKEVFGEIVASPNATVHKLAKRLTELNPRSELKYDLTLKPGETLTLKYDYKTLLYA